VGEKHAYRTPDLLLVSSTWIIRDTGSIPSASCSGHFRSDGYFWVAGTWVLAPEVGLLWTPGYWAFEDGFYVWYPGYWATAVGYYGGIKYGFGYPDPLGGSPDDSALVIPLEAGLDCTLLPCRDP
jgi:hypothetical protein